MNLRAKVFYRRKLVGWIITGLAALALGTMGAGRVLADDDDDSDKGGGAWLGVALQELTPSLREALDLDPHVDGLVIAGVMAESPAEKAGLQEQDVLVSVNGHTVTSVREATDELRKLEPGDRTTVSVLRDGRRRQFTVRLAERDQAENSEWLEQLERTPRPDVPNAPMPPLMAHPEGFEGSHRGYLGVSTIELGEQLADYFEVHGGGVLVTEVSEDSPAEKAGLKAGDIILSVGDSKVDSPSDLMRLVRAHDPEDQVDVVVQRRGNVQTFGVKLGESKDFGFYAPGADHRGMADSYRRMITPEVRQHLMMLGPQIREQMHEHLRQMHDHLRMRNERREGGTVEI